MQGCVGFPIIGNSQMDTRHPFIRDFPVPVKLLDFEHYITVEKIRNWNSLFKKNSKKIQEEKRT